MQSMKIVYHYVLPLLILALSVSYLQSNSRLPGENIIGADDVPVIDYMKKESADREVILATAQRASTTIVKDQRDSNYSVDEADLSDIDSEESNEAVSKAQVEGFMAIYTEDLAGSGDAYENIEGSSTEVETHLASNSNRSDIALNKSYANPSSGQHMNIEISGNQITTTQSGVTINEVYGDSADVNDTTGSVNIDTGAQQNPDTPQNMNTANNEPQDTVELSCPDALYMGGSAYAVSMLKKRGCPRPANYQGPW